MSGSGRAARAHQRAARRLPGARSSTGRSRRPTLGDGGGLNERGAISSDGTRVIWSEERGFVHEELYLSDSERGETIKLNAAQGNGATEPGPGGQKLARTRRRTPGSALPERLERRLEGVLHRHRPPQRRIKPRTDRRRIAGRPVRVRTDERARAKPLRGRLTDLTPDSTAGSADVLNLIPGASEDGSIVYFVANGVLAPGATPGQLPAKPPKARSTAARARPATSTSQSQTRSTPARAQTRFIATLSDEDAADWGAGVTSATHTSITGPQRVTSSVSPDGHYLAFMSDREPHRL